MPEQVTSQEGKSEWNFHVTSKKSGDSPSSRCFLVVLALTDSILPLLPSSSPLHGPSPPSPWVMTVRPEYPQPTYRPQHQARHWKVTKGKVLWIIHLQPEIVWVFPTPQIQECSLQFLYKGIREIIISICFS